MSLPHPIPLLLIGWAAMAVVMTVLWFVQRRHGDAGIVDPAWATGLGVLAILYAFLSPGDIERRVLLAAMGAAWGFRLGYYLLRDRIIGREEDGRYQQLRRKLGPRFQSWLFGFYQMQAIADIIFSVPFVAVLLKRGPLDVWDGAAVAIWLIAVGGETFADAQLARFRANPENRGTTCRDGLWRYSRHPNYFFEWVHWWAYVVMAVGSPWFAATLLGPAAMLFFIVKVTGIPTTEARALMTRGEDYRRYQRTTSPFIPWPPRKENP